MDRIRGRAGFTLAETLITVLILLMVSGVVAAGIPSAANALEKAVDGANAQVLLSTTMTVLRDELANARMNTNDVESPISISDSKKIIYYTGGDGTQMQIESKDYTNTGSDNGIFITPRGGTERSLVSKEAATGNMFAVYDSIEYDKAAGVVTVKDLSVRKGNSVIVSVAEYKIRVISYVPTPVPTSTQGGE